MLVCVHCILCADSVLHIFCSDDVMMMMMYAGMHCTECGYNCHEKCVPHVPKNCTKLRNLTSLTSAQSAATAAKTDSAAAAVESGTNATLVGSVTQAADSTAAGSFHS